MSETPWPVRVLRAYRAIGHLPGNPQVSAAQYELWRALRGVDVDPAYSDAEGRAAEYRETPVLSDGEIAELRWLVARAQAAPRKPIVDLGVGGRCIAAAALVDRLAAARQAAPVPPAAEPAPVRAGAWRRVALAVGALDHETPADVAARVEAMAAKQREPGRLRGGWG